MFYITSLLSVLFFTLSNYLYIELPKNVICNKKKFLHFLKIGIMLTIGLFLVNSENLKYYKNDPMFYFICICISLVIYTLLAISNKYIKTRYLVIYTSLFCEILLSVGLVFYFKNLLI